MDDTSVENVVYSGRSRRGGWVLGLLNVSALGMGSAFGCSVGRAGALDAQGSWVQIQSMAKFYAEHVLLLEGRK